MENKRKDHARTIPKEEKVYPDFITATRNLDLIYAKTITKNIDEKQYLGALENLVLNNSHATDSILHHLLRTAKDSLVLAEAKLLLETLLIADSKWEALLKIHPNPLNNSDIYYSHAKAWSQFNQTQYLFPEEGITQALTYTKNGQPLVHISIKGKFYHFIIDTGAQFSIISSEVAKACEITPVKIEEKNLKSFSKPGIISSLRIENAEIKNLPVMILNKKNLNIRFFKLFTTLKIDGIIGWPQIKELRVEIDNKLRVLKIAKSSTIVNPDPNLIYYLEPVVKTIVSPEVPLHFFLDTGKGKTTLFMRGAKKTKQDYISKGYSISSMLSEMGGSRVQRRKLLKNISIKILEETVKFELIDIEKKDLVYSVFFDGWMGSDIGNNKKTIIDFPKGQFIVE